MLLRLQHDLLGLGALQTQKKPTKLSLVILFVI